MYISVGRAFAYPSGHTAIGWAWALSVTLRFGGDPDQPNYLHVVPEWNYVVRMYLPRKEILDGTWKFPEPVEVK